MLRSLPKFDICCISDTRLFAAAIHESFCQNHWGQKNSGGKSPHSIRFAILRMGPQNQGAGFRRTWRRSMTAGPGLVTGLTARR
jgi:hypothetical protein